jgi:hypothetical protein
MAENNNLSREELSLKQVALEEEALSLGATQQEVDTLARREPASQLPVSFKEDPLTFDDDFGDIDTALQTSPQGSSDAYFESNSIETSLVRRATNPALDATVAYDDTKQALSMSPSVPLTRESYQELYAQDVTNEVRAVVAEDINSDPRFGPVYQETLESLDIVEDEYKGLIGAQKILADTYASETPLSRSVREQEAKGFMGALYREWAEDRGVLDSIMDATGIILQPLSFTMDANDLIKAIDPDFSGDALKELTKVVAGYQVLDPELKQAVLPDLFNAVVEASNENEFQIAAFMGMLSDPDFVLSSKIVGGIEAVEAGTLLASAPLTLPAKTLKSFQKLSSFRQQLKGYGNKAEAVNSTRTKNSTPVGEAMDADATDWENTIIGTNATDELSPIYQRMTDDIKESVVKPIRDAKEEGAFVKIDALTEEEKLSRQTSYLDALKKDNPGTIQRAEVVADNSEGFTVQYQVSTRGDKPVVRQEEIKWTVDDAGSLIAVNEKVSESAVKALGQKLLSPETLLKGIDDKIVADVTFGGLQAATLRKQLATVWKGTEKGLSTKSNVKVDEVLLAGDEASVVYKPGDLLAGNVQTASGKVKLTEAEVKSYYSKRAFLEESWRLQNHITKRQLEFRGFKEARWTNPLNGIEEVQIAKPFKDGRGFTTDPAESIIAPGINGQKVSITKRSDLDVKAAIENGYTPVQFLDPIAINGTRVRFGLIPNTTGKQVVKNLPDNVLNKSVGYVPRISKPGYYYVKDTARSSVRTVARFKTKPAAEEWAATRHAEQVADNVPADQTVNLQVIQDRDFNALGVVAEEANTYGGLYTGARNRTGIFEGEGLADEVSRLSTGQSVQRMVESISNQMPLNEYRIAVVDKWKQGATQALKNQGVESDALIFRQLADPAEWKTVSLNSISDVPTRTALEAHRTYMINSLRIPMNQENGWSNFVMKTADLLPNSKVRDKIVNIASADPLQSLKGATFDAYLGWFNPRQLYVQTQNAALSVSMYPLQAPGAIKDAFIQRIFLYTPTVDKALLKQASKGLAKDADISDMQLSLEQFKRSGLRDGVMRTADYRANLGGFSQGTKESFQKISSAGRIFFEEGESMARLISWNIARRNWKAANPSRAMDDVAIREITDDTLRMNMNMQRENAASWQTNALTAIPTQFLQVQAKLVENVVGGALGNGKWTQKEAAMAFVGQLALYGTAGVPLVEQVAEWSKSQTRAGDPLTFNVENPTIGKAIDTGVVGTFFNAIGFQNNFSDPGSIIAGLDDNVLYDLAVGFSKLASGDSNSINFSAPSVGVVQRGLTAAGSTKDAMMTTYEAAKTFSVAKTLEIAQDSALKAIDDVAAITSTWSNARKIYFLHELGGITDKRGNISISVENMEGISFQSLLAKAMGIPLDIENAYYDQKIMNYDRKKAEQESVRALKKSINTFRINGNKEMFEATQAVILSEWEKEPNVRQELISRTLNSTREQRSGFDRENYQFITNYIRSSGNTGTKSFQANLIKPTPEQE